MPSHHYHRPVVLPLNRVPSAHQRPEEPREKARRPDHQRVSSRKRPPRER